jgi:hypothetical protein
VLDALRADHVRAREAGVPMRAHALAPALDERDAASRTTLERPRVRREKRRQRVDRLVLPSVEQRRNERGYGLVAERLAERDDPLRLGAYGG